jgi:hypothetical protein
MPFNIDKFKSNIANYGYLDNNSFNVYVQTPPILLNNVQNRTVATGNIAENMSFRIDQVRAPGISLQSVDNSRYGVGPTQKQPYNAQFQEVTISLLGDHYCEFWQFWYNWTRAIFQFNSASVNDTAAYSSSYKDQYSSTVLIYFYDHFGRNIQRIDLFECFPVSIREIPLSWGDPNLMRINVSLVYTEYVIESFGTTNNVSQQPNNLRNSQQRSRVNINP